MSRLTPRPRAIESPSPPGKNIKLPKAERKIVTVGKNLAWEPKSGSNIIFPVILRISSGMTGKGTEILEKKIKFKKKWVLGRISNFHELYTPLVEGGDKGDQEAQTGTDPAGEAGPVEETEQGGEAGD